MLGKTSQRLIDYYLYAMKTSCTDTCIAHFFTQTVHMLTEKYASLAHQASIESNNECEKSLEEVVEKCLDILKTQVGEFHELRLIVLNFYSIFLKNFFKEGMKCIY